MRRTKNGAFAMATVMAICMALPARGEAARGHGSAGEENRVAIGAAWRVEGDASGGFTIWLRDLMAAFWGEVRSVIVPGDGGEETNSLTTETDFTDGGA
jgi:hypothetical protein